MIDYRPFRNTDPPALADIWRSQPPQRGLMQPMSPALLERLVLSKPYFDRQGLIVAVDDGRPVGFAHSGFGPGAGSANAPSENGAICMLLVGPHEQRDEIASRLLAAGECYLRAGGVKTLRAGGDFGVGPFYLGLYGGCRLSGVLRSDHWALDLYQRHGYQPRDELAVMQRSLSGFRPPVDRQLIQLRRRFRLDVCEDPRYEGWWRCGALGDAQCTRFSAMSQAGGETRASADLWDIQPLAGSWGVHAAGLLEWNVDETDADEGLALWLLGEALRQMQAGGATLGEAQASPHDALLMSALGRLGFEQVDSTLALEKRDAS